MDGTTATRQQRRQWVAQPRTIGSRPRRCPRRQQQRQGGGQGGVDGRLLVEFVKEYCNRENIGVLGFYF